MPKLYGPAGFRSQSLSDLPRVADEVVPGERQFEAELPLPRVGPPAKHEPSQEAPVSTPIL